MLEGNVFAGVCLSTGGCVGVGMPGPGPGGGYVWSQVPWGGGGGGGYAWSQVSLLEWVGMPGYRPLPGRVGVHGVGITREGKGMFRGWVCSVVMSKGMGREYTRGDGAGIPEDGRMGILQVYQTDGVYKEVRAVYAHAQTWDLDTHSGSHHNTYGWRVGGMHPTGMLSCSH